MKKYVALAMVLAVLLLGGCRKAAAPSGESHPTTTAPVEPSGTTAPMTTAPSQPATTAPAEPVAPTTTTPGGIDLPEINI